MSEQLLPRQETSEVNSSVDHNGGDPTEEPAQELEPTLQVDLEESQPEVLSFPAGELTLEQAYQALAQVVEARRVRRRQEFESRYSDKPAAIAARNRRAEQTLTEKEASVAAAIKQFETAAVFPSDKLLAEAVDGIKPVGTPLELVKERLYQVYTQHHLPRLAELSVRFVAGSESDAAKGRFTDLRTQEEVSTINLQPDEVWVAIEQARSESPARSVQAEPEPPAEVPPEDPEPEKPEPDLETETESLQPPAAEQPAPDYVVLGDLLGQFIRQYTGDVTRTDLPTEADIAAAYAEEVDTPLPEAFLERTARQFREEVQEERERLARVAERAEGQQPTVPAETPVPDAATIERAALDQVREDVLPALIDRDTPVSWEQFGIALRRAGASVTLPERDLLYAELLEARGETPERTEDDQIADVMADFVVARTVPTLDELRQRFATLEIPQTEADLEYLHTAIEQLVADEQAQEAAEQQARVAAERQAQHEAARGDREQELGRIDAAVDAIMDYDWLHAHTVQDLVAYQRITEPAEDDGIARVLQDVTPERHTENQITRVLYQPEFQDLTPAQQERVLTRVGWLLADVFTRSRESAAQASERLTSAAQTAQSAAEAAQTALEDTRPGGAPEYRPMAPAPQLTDTTQYQPDLQREEWEQSAREAAAQAKQSTRDLLTKTQQKADEVAKMHAQEPLGNRLLKWLDRKLISPKSKSDLD